MKDKKELIIKIADMIDETFGDEGTYDVRCEELAERIVKLITIPDAIMWRCSHQFRMKDTKEVCFKNGGIYEQLKEKPLTLKDEDGIAHELAPHWAKWFQSIT